MSHPEADVKQGGAMANRAYADRLLDLCSHQSRDISGQWYKLIDTNVRTQAFRAISGDTMQSIAASIYSNLKQMYFSNNPFDEVNAFMNKLGYAEITFMKNVPLSQVIYGLILMRRQIWLAADLQALFVDDTAIGVHEETTAVNRIVLMFDYIIFSTVESYEKLAAREREASIAAARVGKVR
jgi:hypothetical protein